MTQERGQRLDPPGAVREIAERLEQAGYETWCVGGAVRDALLGRPHLDWDLATRATPDTVRALFRRTAPVGIQFGTVAVIDRRGVPHEVTTFRRDVRTDGRHAQVEFGVSLDDDLARRDFTINAIAYSPRTRTLYDPFDGQHDLARGIVRAVGDPAARMTEDRLRALRAIRFAARFDFAIEPATWDAIVASAPFLTRLSPERVRQELEKTVQQVKRPSRALAMWRRSGALRTLLPVLETQPATTLEAADQIALPEQTARAELASSRSIDRLASLFLSLEPHAVRAALRDLRFANREVDWIGHLVDRWRELEPRMRAALLSEAPVPDAEVRRWAARAGRTAFRSLWRVTRARWMAEGQAGGVVPAPPRVSSVYRRALRAAYREPVAIDDLAIDGNDLRDLGIPPGPRVGAVLRWLLSQVLEDPSRNSRPVLLGLAASAPESLGSAGSEAR
jgi:tRNA nucleotidyltransferase (CCA-adding enzyme)